MLSSLYASMLYALLFFYALLSFSSYLFSFIIFSKYQGIFTGVQESLLYKKLNNLYMARVLQIALWCSDNTHQMCANTTRATCSWYIIVFVGGRYIVVHNVFHINEPPLILVEPSVITHCHYQGTLKFIASVNKYTRRCTVTICSAKTLGRLLLYWIMFFAFGVFIASFGFDVAANWEASRSSRAVICPAFCLWPLLIISSKCIRASAWAFERCANSHSFRKHKHKRSHWWQ